MPLKSYSTQPFPVATSGAQPGSLAKSPFPVGRPPQVLPMFTYVWSSLRDNQSTTLQTYKNLFLLLTQQGGGNKGATLSQGNGDKGGGEPSSPACVRDIIDSAIERHLVQDLTVKCKSVLVQYYYVYQYSL